MKKFIEENHVTMCEMPRLKAKMMDTIFTRDQWYNRYRGCTPLTKAEAACMKHALDEVRAELKQLTSTRPLDELDK